jgi:YhcH/YjgK/YiaL family protein
MTIYGTVETCAAQVGDRPYFATALAFLSDLLGGGSEAARTLNALGEGEMVRLNLEGPEGRDVYALLQHPRTRPRSEQQAESHRVYADVQAVVDGDEILEVMPLAGLETTRPYSAEGDAALYRMPETASRLVMRPGLAAIVFPEDAHAPMQAPDGTPRFSRRVVLKVRVADPA